MCERVARVEGNKRADEKVDGGDDDDAKGRPEGRAVGAGDAEVVEDDALGLAGALPLVEHARRLLVWHRAQQARALRRTERRGKGKRTVSQSV